MPFTSTRSWDSELQQQSNWILQPHKQHKIWDMENQSFIQCCLQDSLGNLWPNITSNLKTQWSQQIITQRQRREKNKAHPKKIKQSQHKPLSHMHCLLPWNCPNVSRRSCILESKCPNQLARTLNGLYTASSQNLCNVHLSPCVKRGHCLASYLLIPFFHQHSEYVQIHVALISPQIQSLLQISPPKPKCPMAENYSCFDTETSIRNTLDTSWNAGI